MVALVQRPRGRLGLLESFSHLPWPSGVAPIEKSQYYWEGRDAYGVGKMLCNNPYMEGTQPSQHWNLGWIRSRVIKEGL